VRNIRWLGKRWPRMFSHASGLFARHGLKAVFFSKFIYGTRIAAQMLAGLSRLRFSRYLLVNVLSVLVWLALLLGIGMAIDQVADSFGIRVHKAYLLLGLFIPGVLLARFALGHFTSRFLAMPDSQDLNHRYRARDRIVSAIVPAFNEAETVANVVHVLEQHPAIDDIIVVDD